jgi:DNA-binding LacI/PurR family transcriptional regulator
MSPKPTIRAIASALGVSPMSVSNALRGKANVSSKLRQRVLRKAAEVGYTPDPLVTRLMAHLRRDRSHRELANIALLLPYESGYTERLEVGVRLRAAELGFAVDVFRSDRLGEHPRKIERVLKARGIDGLLLGPLPRPGRARFLDDWSSFSVVSLSYSVSEPWFHHVVPHQMQNTTTALNKLRSLGAQRLAVVIGRDYDERVSHTCSAALALDALRHGQPVLPPFLMGPGAEKKLPGWLAQHCPDGIVSTSCPMLAGAVVPAVTLAGIAPPLYASLARSGAEPFPGIDQREELIGATALDALAERLNRNEQGPPEVAVVTMVEGIWSSPPEPPEEQQF